MDNNTSPVTYILGAVLLAVVAGGTIYVAQLREENARLKAQTAARPASAGAAAAPAAAAPQAAGKRVIADDDRRLMVAKLQGDGGSPVWFATMAGNAEAAAFQKALQSVFEEAGWQVKGSALITFQVKPGVFIFAADDDAPPYLTQVMDAFGVLGIAPTLGTGYREFYKTKKAENPGWNGFELADDQAYVVVIGPKPAG